MNNKIIAAFPLCGKSHYTKSHEGCLDSDSSNFSWVDKDGKRERNGLFPLNYVLHILNAANSPECTHIFISTHNDVLKMLDEMEIEYALVYPPDTPEAKDEWLKRFDNREFNGFTRETLENNWEKWHRDMESHAERANVTPVVLNAGQYMSDVVA